MLVVLYLWLLFSLDASNYIKGFKHLNIGLRRFYRLYGYYYPTRSNDDALQSKLVKILDRQLGTIGVSTTTCSDNVTLIALNHTDTSLQALTHIAEHESHLNRCEVSGLKTKVMVMYRKTHTSVDLKGLPDMAPGSYQTLDVSHVTVEETNVDIFGQIVARLQNRWIP